MSARLLLRAEELARTTFIVDCDGESTRAWLSDEIIVTDTCDLEADLLIGLELSTSIATQVLARRYGDISAVHETAKSISTYAQDVSAGLGVVLNAGRSVGVSVSTRDLRTGKKRRTRLSDIPDAPKWASSHSQTPEVTVLLDQVAALKGWSTADKDAVCARLSAGGKKPCRRHGTGNCSPCIARRFSNGHDVVEALEMTLAVELGPGCLAPHEIESLAIASSTSMDRSKWKVLARLRNRELATGLSLVR